MIAVTHLLGTGHLARALTLARAFAAADNAVTIVSGGTSVGHFETTGLRFEQLPEVRSNGTDFTTLLNRDGQVASHAMLVARQQRLLAILRDVQPDILITELFPFGRRILRNEFIELLQAGRDMALQPVTLASVRDILAPPSKPSKVTFAEDLINRFYHGVLVHADPDVVRLDRSWPVSGSLERRLYYTGFVAPAPPADPPSRQAGVLVSAGGGNVGDKVFGAACDAARLLPDVAWCIFISGPDERRTSFAAYAPKNVTIQAPRSDFRHLMATADVSVSMVGYNTVMDVLQTGVPAVLIPFDDGDEVEQGLRAQALIALRATSLIRQDVLDGASLAREVSALMTQSRRTPKADGMDGAAVTVKIAHRLHVERAK
jgi:predicted glycosyltransferase